MVKKRKRRNIENHELKRFEEESSDIVIIAEMGFKYYTLDGIKDNVIAFLAESTENDPVVVFNWTADIMQSCVTWANNNQMALPAWFHATYPLNEKVIRVQILNYAAQVTNGKIHQDAIIAPNSLTEFGAIQAKLMALCFDPFIIALCGNNRCPLATIFVVPDGKRPAQVESTNFPVVPVGAVQAFQ